MADTRNPSQRIKGQEVTVLLTRDGALEDTLVDIQSLEVTAKLEEKEAGYLGEKTNRHDEIFNGLKFTMELHLHKQDWYPFLQAIIDRAQRNTPDVVINITAVMSFPNGETPTMLIQDAKFGAVPMSISTRGDYVKVKLEGSADNWSATTS